jgi:hypothetical protein
VTQGYRGSRRHAYKLRSFSSSFPTRSRFRPSQRRLSCLFSSRSTTGSAIPFSTRPRTSLLPSVRHAGTCGAFLFRLYPDRCRALRTSELSDVHRARRGRVSRISGWPCAPPAGQLAGEPCACAAARSRQALLLVSVVGERLAGKTGTSSSIVCSGDASLISCYSSRSRSSQTLRVSPRALRWYLSPACRTNRAPACADLLTERPVVLTY